MALALHYALLADIGDGSFGSVSLAVCRATGDQVAVKRMKKPYCSWAQCLALREVKSLQRLVHPNIVRLRELIRDADRLYFVFDYAQDNLYHLMRLRADATPRSRFENAEIQSLILQLFLGLAYMHKCGYFHRDIKPENLLLRLAPQAPPVVKIADFGLAREIRAKPPYSEYISTRWYRAPEVLLRMPYSAPIDIWAAACIIPELYALEPLFPGISEIDQMYRIAALLGKPPSPSSSSASTSSTSSSSSSSSSVSVSVSVSVSGNGNHGAPLGGIFPAYATPDARALTAAVLTYDALARPTAAAALSFAFLRTAPELAACDIAADTFTLVPKANQVQENPEHNQNQNQRQKQELAPASASAFELTSMAEPEFKESESDTLVVNFITSPARRTNVNLNLNLVPNAEEELKPPPTLPPDAEPLDLDRVAADLESLGTRIPQVPLDSQRPPISKQRLKHMQQQNTTSNTNTAAAAAAAASNNSDSINNVGGGFAARLRRLAFQGRRNHPKQQQQQQQRRRSSSSNSNSNGYDGGGDGGGSPAGGIVKNPRSPTDRRFSSPKSPKSPKRSPTGVAGAKQVNVPANSSSSSSSRIIK